VSIPALVYGGFLVMVGALGVAYPTEVARLSEWIDAIGRRGGGPVEPRAWLVALTRVMGGVAALLGAVIVVTALAP